MLELILDGVLVFLPGLWVLALVDKACRLIDVGLGLCRIVEGQRFGEVVTQLIVTGPVPLLGEGRCDVDDAAALVAHLTLRIVTVHLGIEGDALRQVVEVDVLDDLPGGFGGPFGFGEGLNRLGVACIVVAQTTTIGLHQVVFDVCVLLECLVVGEGEVEVLDVVDVHLGHVATTASKASVGVSLVFGRVLAFPFVVFLFLGNTFFPDIHEVDVLLTGVVMDG